MTDEELGTVIDESATPAIDSVTGATTPVAPAMSFPMLTPNVLGVTAPAGPAPQAPTSRMSPEEARRRKALALATIAFTLGAGSRGRGFAHGVLEHQQQQDAERLRQTQLDQQVYQDQLRVYEAQQRQAEQDAEQRRQALMGAVASFQKEVPTFKTQAEYEQATDRFAAFLRNAGGFRIDAKWLQQAAPYAPPNKAAALWGKIQKSPYFKEAFDKNPDAALNSVFPTGEGLPALPVWRIAELAGEPFLRSPEGTWLNQPKGVTGSEFSIAYNNGLDKFRHEKGREPDATERDTIVQHAADVAKGTQTTDGTEFDRFVAKRQKELGRELTSRELVRARREYFGNTDDAGGNQAKQRARDALYASMLRGDAISRQVGQQLSQAGLDSTKEVADVRAKLLAVGQSLLTPDERQMAPPEGYAPDQLIGRARKALVGEMAPSETPTTAAATPASAPSDSAIRAEARRQLEAARKGSGDTRPVTDADINAVLGRPGNLAKLRQQVRPQ